MYPISKIMWWKENKREMYRKTWKFLGWEDFLAYKLCGKPITSFSLASRTMLFDLKKQKWSEKILDLIDLPADKLPEIIESGKQIDAINAAQFREFDIYDKAILISGGWDQACAALGAGAIDEDVLLDSFGTTMCYGTVIRQLIMNKEIFSGGYQISQFLFGNRYFLNGGNLNGGILLKLFKEKVTHEPANGKHLDFNPTTMYFFPNFAGSGTPYIDAVSCGGMLNLNYEIDADQIYKSILESLCFELKDNVKFIENMTNNNYAEIIFVGGGSKSE
jgi:xylulokinase